MENPGRNQGGKCLRTYSTRSKVVCGLNSCITQQIAEAAANAAAIDKARRDSHAKTVVPHTTKLQSNHFGV